VTPLGTDNVNKGSTSATSAKIFLSTTPALEPSTIIIEKTETSEPVPEVVGINTSGALLFGTLPIPTKSSYFPGLVTSIATALATSIALPPPKPNTPSQLFSLYKSSASYTFSTGGSGWTLL